MAATLTELRQKRKAFIDGLKTLSAKEGAFSNEERAKIKADKAEIEALDAQIATAEADEQQLAADANDRSWILGLAKGADEPLPRKTQPDTLAKRYDEQGRMTSYVEASDELAGVEYDGSLDANKRHWRSHLEARKGDWARLRKSGYKPCGQGGAYDSLASFVRDGFENHGTERFRSKLDQHYSLAIQGMSESVASEGGYLVMPEYSAGIIDRVYSNPLWSRTQNYTVTGNTMTFTANSETSRATGSRHGGLRGYWIEEGGSFTSSIPKFRRFELKLVKLGVLVYLTQELIDDGGSALQQYVARKAGEEFEFLIGDSLINGTGAGQPTGLLNAPSLLSIAKESGQAASTIVPQNIEKMYARHFSQNAVWTHHKDIRPQLDLMTLAVGTGGSAVYMPNNNVAGAPFGTLKGLPLLPTEFNATLGTQGDLILADFGQVISISKGGIMSAASLHVQFLTDQLVLRFVMRLNAAPWETAAVTPFKGSNTTSNFVTLDTRS